MRAGIVLVSVLTALGASCFSPAYHDGSLRCAASGQCPEGYHCAADKTCWHNGSDPDAGAGAGQPDVMVLSDAALSAAADDARSANDGPAMPDLPVGIGVDTRDLARLADGLPASDPPSGRDSPSADAGEVDARDAPAADTALQADGADATGGEAASAGIPLDQLAAEYARVVCTRNFACCAQSDLKGKTLASCEQSVANLLQSPVQAVVDGESRGRTVYYPERARQCLQAIEATSCGDWPLDPVTQLPAMCTSAVEPLVPSGGPCRSAAECTTGLCTGASSSADGACLPKATSGQGCVQILGQNSCERGLYCDSTNQCSATKTDGTSCAGNRECQSLTCGPAPDAGNICVPAACYSNGPLLPPACSFGGRPSPFVAALVLAATLASVLRTRSARRRARKTTRT